jgi:hypothetical protein
VLKAASHWFLRRKGNKNAITNWPNERRTIERLKVDSFMGQDIMK